MLVRTTDEFYYTCKSQRSCVESMSATWVIELIVFKVQLLLTAEHLYKRFLWGPCFSLSSSLQSMSDIVS